jgi:tetratricopeptide (TPR) repeat protein
MVVAVVLGWTAIASAQETDAPAEDWQARQDQGLELYQQGRHAEAAAAFEEAEALGAPAPNLYNLARCYQALERYQDAVDTFDRYLAVPDLPEDRRARAQQYRDEAASHFAPVEESTPPEPAPGPIDEAPPPPVTAPEELPPTHPAQRPSRWPSAVFAAGLSVAVAGVVLYVVAYEATQRTEPFGTWDEFDRWQYQTYDTALAGDVLVGVGAGLAVAGALWWAIAALRARAAMSGHSRGPRLAATGCGPGLRLEF